MPKYRVWTQREPFNDNLATSLLVEAEDAADAYLTAYAHLTGRGHAVNTVDVFSNLYQAFDADTLAKLAAAGLAHVGYPARLHIRRVELEPAVPAHRGRVLADA